MKAKLFADHEEREIQRLCANIVNNQLKILELKLRQFAEIETLLMKECEQVEKTRQRFVAQRSCVMSACIGTGGAASSMVNSNNNSRQQISAASSQPSISGMEIANLFIHTCPSSQGLQCLVENGTSRNHQESFDVSIDVSQQGGSNKIFDDDGHPKRTGTVWTTSSHIITAVIGSGVLSLAWAIAQLGWIAGPVVMIIFSVVTYYMSTLLAVCYRTGDPVNGKRNYTYMDAVQSILGGFQVKICGFVQYLNLFGVAIGYTIASSISMMAIKRSSCFHNSGGKDPCHMNGNWYMIGFGIAEIIFSQIPNFDQLSWLSIVAAIMSFTYSIIGLCLGIGKVVGNKEIKGTMTGISIGSVTQAQKIWRSFQALGDMAFAYSYSMILIELQDTIKSPPSEAKTMKKATLISSIVTTFFYMLCGCFGYAAFGDSSPGNLLTGFGFYNPFWLLDIANVAIVVHLVGAYQVYCQPLFSFIESNTAKKFPNSDFVNKEVDIPIPGCHSYKLNYFRLVWRTIFVIVSTVIAMLLPFFNDILGLLGAIAFWPLTVYFPMEMYIIQMRIPKWSAKWIWLEVLSVACFIITIISAAGSIVGIIEALNDYKPFESNY